MGIKLKISWQKITLTVGGGFEVEKSRNLGMILNGALRKRPLPTRLLQCHVIARVLLRKAPKSTKFEASISHLHVLKPPIFIIRLGDGRLRWRTSEAIGLEAPRSSNTFLHLLGTKTSRASPMNSITPQFSS